MKLPFSKGHGTGNDFILVLDPTDAIQLDASQVAALCDRSFGIGADGLIRMVKQDDLWFMDYRNSDGSLAEICGNGTRVMSRYLIEHNLVGDAEFELSTRAGLIPVKVNSDSSISVELGPVVLTNQEVEVTASNNRFTGRLVTAPNPHVVSIVESLAEPGNLLTEPEFNHNQLPGGANFEFVQLIGHREIAMRVHERGVGETLSCGSGACAVAVFMQEFWQTDKPIVVNVPGGQLLLESLPNQKVRLTGPAIILASGEVDLDKLVTR